MSSFRFSCIKSCTIGSNYLKVTVNPLITMLAKTGGDFVHDHVRLLIFLSPIFLIVFRKD